MGTIRGTLATHSPAPERDFFVAWRHLSSLRREDHLGVSAPPLLIQEGKPARVEHGVVESRTRGGPLDLLTRVLRLGADKPS